MFLNCQSVKQHIVLRAQSQALSDGIHVCNDTIAIDVS